MESHPGKVDARRGGYSWHGKELFDFSGGQFDDIDLDSIRLTEMRVLFRNCVFRNGEIRLGGTKLRDVLLDFTGSTFQNVKIIMQGSVLSGSTEVLLVSFSRPGAR